MAPLYIIGTGPGALSHMTEAARRAIAESGVVVGYGVYIDLIRPLLAGKEVISTPMMQEVERCREAIARARSGATVALVSGGDAGIYGMAGLVLELLERDAAGGDRNQPDVRVIPGISALQAAAAVLGAPVMHDFAAISLSDLLTPWELIRSRLEAAARADFVICLYNPRSRKRVTQLREARAIILGARPGHTPVGIVRNACREDEAATVTTLASLLEHEIDMFSIVVIGNSATFVDSRGRMVTPRGYAGKLAPLSPRPEKAADGAGAVMFCGTASDVGKSVITAGFCRCLVRRGLSVAPFKSQNMSNNSSVTPEGGEIGRAQAVQAQACGIPPHTDMNPVLLKPNSDTGSQVIVQGRAVANMGIREYDAFKPQAWEKVRESFERLRNGHEFIVMEGAGSIAEINLRHSDIANLKVALMANCPVILVADIDRGGVFAQIAGTIDLLEPREREMIRGVIINKFRGDPTILAPGIDFIQERTGVPVLGVLPWLADLDLPAEDSVVLGRHPATPLPGSGGQIRIGVLKLPRISNFTDFDPLQREPDVCLAYVESAEQLAGLDVLILPGSKSTLADLGFLEERGISAAIRAFDGRIVGICGGYQMLGQRVLDPDGVESAVPEAAGLGLLPVETRMLAKKETHQARAHLEGGGLALADGNDAVVTGYEIHMGRTTHLEAPRPFSRIFRRGTSPVAVEDGSVSPDGRIFGTYLHGLFDNAPFREGYLNRIRRAKGLPLRKESGETTRPDPFERLADHLESHLDMPRLLAICGVGSDHP
ncbi:MAG TPA: cobyric acid synthase [Desulfuromonadaceae bacterium]